MKKFSLSVLALAFVSLSACSHNPNKAEKIETEMEKSSQISGDTTLGVKKGNMVVQKKTLMAEELRDLQNDVYSTEDKVYGNAKYNSLGLYGVLRNCKLSLSDKKNGGDGKLMWTEPIDRVTDKEDDFQIGLDEKDKIVALNEEFVKDRIARFREYKRVLKKREIEYQEKLDICQAELKSRQTEKASN